MAEEVFELDAVFSGHATKKLSKKQFQQCAQLPHLYEVVSRDNLVVRKMSSDERQIIAVLMAVILEFTKKEKSVNVDILNSMIHNEDTLEVFCGFSVAKDKVEAVLNEPDGASKQCALVDFLGLKSAVFLVEQGRQPIGQWKVKLQPDLEETVVKLADEVGELELADEQSDDGSSGVDDELAEAEQALADVLVCLVKKALSENRVPTVEQLYCIIMDEQTLTRLHKDAYLTKVLVQGVLERAGNEAVVAARGTARLLEFMKLQDHIFELQSDFVSVPKCQVRLKQGVKKITDEEWNFIYGLIHAVQYFGQGATVYKLHKLIHNESALKGSVGLKLTKEFVGKVLQGATKSGNLRDFLKLFPEVFTLGGNIWKWHECTVAVKAKFLESPFYKNNLHQKFGKGREATKNQQKRKESETSQQRTGGFAGHRQHESAAGGVGPQPQRQMEQQHHVPPDPYSAPSQQFAHSPSGFTHRQPPPAMNFSHPPPIYPGQPANNPYRQDAYQYHHPYGLSQQQFRPGPVPPYRGMMGQHYGPRPRPPQPVGSPVAEGVGVYNQSQLGRGGRGGPGRGRGATVQRGGGVTNWRGRGRGWVPRGRGGPPPRGRGAGRPESRASSTVDESEKREKETPQQPTGTAASASGRAEEDHGAVMEQWMALSFKLMKKLQKN